MLKNLSLFFIILVSISVCSGNSDQTNKKDPSSKEKVFFDASILDIKAGDWEDLDSAIYDINSAIHYYNKEDLECSVFRAQSIKARLFFNIGMLDSATSVFLRASSSLRETCSSLDRYYFYNSWTILYLEMNDFNSGDSLSMLALEATAGLEDKNYELNVLTNRSLLFANNGKTDTAISIMKNIYSTSIEIQNQYHVWSSLQNLGHFFLQKSEAEGNYLDSAYFYLSKLSNTVTADMPVYLEMHLYNNLAVYFSKKGNEKKAAEFYLKAVNLAKENGELNSLEIYLYNYSNALRRLGKYEEANLYLIEYVKLKDSLLSAEKVKIIKEFEKEYESSKQREKIIELEKEDLAKNLELEKVNRNRDVTLLVLLGVVLFSIGLYRRLLYIRKSKGLVEKAKKRSDDLLLNILPEQIAEELKETGESQAKSFEDVSVLFTDFKSFTEISEKLNAKDLVDEINTCFKAFDEIVKRYKIEKIKTIGDSYMAAGGLNSPRISSAADVVRAALEMQDFMIARKVLRDSQSQPSFQMRVGINTGPVVAGIVGVIKFQYDIWGDVVNVASRMESSGDVGKLNISKQTYLLIKDNPSFEFESRGKIRAKGKGDVEMYFVYLK